MKIIAKVLAIFTALFLAAFLIGWIYISIPVAHVSLSKNSHCKLEFHQLLTGKCILSYYVAGTCMGTTTLHSDLLNNPLACFPGPDEKSVICLSDLDTFQAAFTVDFTKRNNKGTAIPPRLQEPGQEAVDHSDFEVRACTYEEVDFVKQYIKTVDLSTLSNCIRWGARPETRQGVLKFLIYATTPNNWQDPVLKDAHPLMLPAEP
jgi:hypothetical protein